MESQNPEWLNVLQAAQFLQSHGVPVAEATLNAWRGSGREKIPFHRFGRLIRYSRNDLLIWAQSRRVDPTEREKEAMKSRRARAGPNTRS